MPFPPLKKGGEGGLTARRPEKTPPAPRSSRREVWEHAPEPGAYAPHGGRIEVGGNPRRSITPTLALPIEGEGTRRGMATSVPVLGKRHATATAEAGHGVRARVRACERGGNAL